LSNVHNGKGVLLGGVTGITPTEIIIIGAGTIAEFAARTALGLGASVKVFDLSAHKLRQLQSNVGQRLFTSILHPKVLKNTLKTADVVIGALEFDGNSPRFIVEEDIVRSMKRNSVIIDLAISQGGCFETSRLTNFEDPSFVKHGVTHYCIPNVPARVARTASIALSDIIGPIVYNLGEAGSLNQLLKEDVGIRKGVYTYHGILTNDFIGSQLNIPSPHIDLLLPHM
jgi:alanine dehydrogenase